MNFQIIIFTFLVISGAHNTVSCCEQLFGDCWHSETENGNSRDPPCCEQLFGDCWHRESDEDSSCLERDDGNEETDDVNDISDDEDTHNDQSTVSLPVLSFMHNKCIICNQTVNKMFTMPPELRTSVFINQNVIVPSGARCCHKHTHKNSLKPGITIDRSKVKQVHPHNLPPIVIVKLINSLRTAALSPGSAVDFDAGKMSDDDCYNLTGIHIKDLDDLVATCKSLKISKLRSPRAAIGLFLCKMRTGLSDNILATVFHIKSRRDVSRIVAQVRVAMMKDFVPYNLGFEHISRDEIIKNHTTLLARELLANGNSDVAILIMDGTYIYIQKSGKYGFQCISFSMHKHRPLVKPMLIVSTSGYILAVLGPYMAKNNDADITKHILSDNREGIKEWLRPDDIFVLDRGFRDCIEMLQSLGYEVESPAFLGKASQHSTEEANTSRLVTKIRWVVESVNGRLKKWEFLNKVLANQHIQPIGDYVQIIAAICNKYRPPIKRDSVEDRAVARKMLERAKLTVNPLQQHIEAIGKKPLVAKWKRLDGAVLDNFPVLSLEYIRNLTLGIYQLKQAESYTKEHLSDDGVYHMWGYKQDADLYCIKLQSRHVSSKKYLIWIQIHQDHDQSDPIKCWYCECPNGARLVGCCAHVASVLWYLGVSRHYLDSTSREGLIPKNIVNSPDRNTVTL